MSYTRRIRMLNKNTQTINNLKQQLADRDAWSGRKALTKRIENLQLECRGLLARAEGAENKNIELELLNEDLLERCGETVKEEEAAG